MPTINDADVLCPFYSNATEKGIMCEGVTDNSVLKLLFKQTKFMYAYRRIYCCGRYTDCNIYKMLEKKYEE